MDFLLQILPFSAFRTFNVFANTAFGASIYMSIHI